MLNPASPVPLYRQLADDLLASIRDGRLHVGSRIPGEHELAERHGIGRPTVRQATEVLVRRGVLQRRRGAGTFVARPPQDVDLFSLGGTLSAFEGGGAAVTHAWLSTPRSATARGDSPLAGRKVWQLARLTSMSSQPVLREDFELDASVFADLDQHDLAGRSLSELVLEHYHREPIGGRQVFAVHAGAVPQLSDADTPTLLIRRTLDFVGAAAAVHVLMYCRTDRCRFSHAFGPDNEPNDRNSR